MARPKVDAAAIRADMMDAAEALLAESGGRRLVLSDIAVRLGRSQSYVHSHFRTKHDLIAALAERWFADVERAAREADAAGSPRERLRNQVLATLAVKKAKHDADPVLFRAFLALAAEHGDVVAAHAQRLRALMRDAMAGYAGPDRVDDALAVFEDATVQFRLPQMIALKPDHATAERADSTLAAVLDGLAPEGRLNAE